LQIEDRKKNFTKKQAAVCLSNN